MTAPLLVVTGTGTGIGKTHVAAALVHAWRAVLEAAGRPCDVAGLKPVETGVGGEADGAPSDGQTLERASTFHVKRHPPPYLLARAVSPHLAAADEGVTIEVAVIAAYVEEVRRRAAGVVVELAGGLFSPLSARAANVDAALALGPTGVVLVVPDRLGALHDVAATTRAARAAGLEVTGIVMVAPERPDSSTGTNARELSVVTEVPVLAEVPRGSVADTALRADLRGIVRALLTPKTTPPRP